MAARLAGVAADEARVDAATAEFLRAALPAAPALVLGFLCREGALLARRPAQAPQASLCSQAHRALDGRRRGCSQSRHGPHTNGAGVPCGEVAALAWWSARA